MRESLFDSGSGRRAPGRYEKGTDMSNQPTLAERGIAVAKTFIERQGYSILAENWSDVHCRTVVFVAAVNGKLHLVDVSVRRLESHVTAPLCEAEAALVR